VTVLLVLLGGALGAAARYLTDHAVRSRHPSRFPWGILTVNVAGSLVAGAVGAAVVTAGAPEWLLTVVGTGFCGALTTFSTFGLDTIRLIENGSHRLAAANVVLSVAAGLLAAVTGWYAVALLS
jgi:CrcB protein